MNVMKNIWKYILIAIPVLLVLAVAVFYLIKLPTNEKQAKYAEYITQSNSFYEQKEFAKALNSLNLASQLIPNNYQAYEGIAKILVDKNQLGQLTQVLEKSATLLTNDQQSQLYSILGEGYIKVRNYELAKNNYQKAVDLSYTNEIAKLGLSNSYLGLGDYTKASSYLDIPTNSVNYEKAYLLKLISSFKDTAKIAEILKEELKVTDTTIAKYVNDYIKISKVDTKDELYVSTLLARIYVINGYNQLSLNILEPQKENMMEYQDAVYILAVSYFNQGDATKALELLRDYSNPNANPDIYLLEARAYVKSTDIEQAIKKYDQAVASAGDDVEPIYVEYVDFLLDQAQYAKAKDVLDKADKKLNENWIEVAYLRMYVLQKDNTKSQFYTDKLAKSTTLLDNEKKEYMYWAIYQYIETQKNSDATILLAKLKEIDSKNPEYYLLNGKLYLATANAKEAKANLEMAIDLDLKGDVTDTAKKLLSRVN